jgi:hypothetical protein
MKRAIIVVILFCFCQTATAQTPVSPLMHFKPVWMPQAGSFLEANRFVITDDISRTSLRLEGGFGADIAQFDYTAFGGEGLIWSRLKSLSGFRFPVETADYFFGLYSVFPLVIYRGNEHYYFLRNRFRIGHISSHYVDGIPDSIVGGSSSHFSREFISLETETTFDESTRRWERGTFGIKYVFHQVTKVEPTIQIPVSIDIIPYRSNGKFRNELFLTLSNNASGYYPQYSAALTFRIRNNASSVIDLYGDYHSGASRYGVEGTSKEHGFEFGVKMALVPQLRWENKSIQY